MKQTFCSLAFSASLLILPIACKSPFRDKIYTVKVTDAYTNQAIQGAKVTLYKYDSSDPNSQPAEFANATSNSNGDVSFTIDFGNRGIDDAFLYKVSILNYVDVATFDADLCGSAAQGFVKARGTDLDLEKTTPQTVIVYPIAHLSIQINPTTLTGNPLRVVVKSPAPDCFIKSNFTYDNSNFWFESNPFSLSQPIGPVKAIANKPIQLQITAYDSSSAVMLSKSVDARSFLPGSQTVTIDF